MQYVQDFPRTLNMPSYLPIDVLVFGIDDWSYIQYNYDWKIES